MGKESRYLQECNMNMYLKDISPVIINWKDSAQVADHC